jgi:hypothetical protein
MDRDQLIDLTRRAVKLARDKTTDLTPSEHTVLADTYTSTQRHSQDRAMLMASPQLVGYASELPRPGMYCSKTVMGRSVLLTRNSDNVVRASTTSACTASHASPKAAELRAGLPVRTTRGSTTLTAASSACRARKDSPKHAPAQRN